MEIWAYIRILFALFYLGPVVAFQFSSSSCPQFASSFVAAIDEKIDSPGAFFIDDPELTYLKNVLNLQDDAIQHTFQDAISFFKMTYGLDFSVSLPNEKNEYVYENATLRVFRFADIGYLAIANSWIQTGSSNSKCYQIHDGGFTVSFSGEQLLHGEYGGTDGILVRETEFVNYGFYVIGVCQQSPMVIQYQSATPVRQEPTDGTFILSCELYNRVLGYGRSDGIFTIKPAEDEPGKFRLIARQAFLFPGKTSPLTINV